MKRALIIILVLALALIMLVPVVASANNGAGDCGKAHGEFHSAAARGEGPVNLSNRDGLKDHNAGMHKGAAGFCGLGVGAG